MKTYQPHISSIGGLSANLVAALCYIAVFLFGPIGLFASIVVFFYEKNSGLVKFHAMQAVTLCVLQNIISYALKMIFGVFPRFGILYVFEIIGQFSSFVAATVVFIVFAVLYFLGAASAYRWNVGVIPFVGQIAQGICNASSRPAYTGNGSVPSHCQPSANASHSSDNVHPYRDTPANGYQAPKGNTAPTPPPNYTPETYSRPQSRSQSPYCSPPIHDPNSQLPEDMRDKPQSGDMM